MEDSTVQQEDDNSMLIQHSLLKNIRCITIVFLVCFISCDFNGSAANVSKPDPGRFTQIVLAAGLDEPLQMEVLSNNDVLFIERKGSVKIYKADEKKVLTIANFNVFSGIEDGLLGMAADPDYIKNNWVYFYYSVAGDKWRNRLSRFELKDNQLVPGSEKRLLEIPTQRVYCCHSAGCITFDPEGLLYLSTGDNTAASAASKEGYPPIDERPGQELADAQATAANSNDLRGKILRIKPEPEGGYSIPDGNLFPKDGSEGRPEIYVMGCRNPYRVSVDPKNGYVYWGEVGPNTIVRGKDSTIANYDEINQARSAGFFGWPYFIGNNDAYPDYDYATKIAGPRFDPEHPVNTSPNNTGIQQLPPARPALIWYGIDSSAQFPLLGKGTATAIAGPVYYSDLYKDARYKLPGYYNGKLFIYDWMRRWIMAVTLDEQGNYKSMEPFLEHLHLTAPIDMKIGPDGAIYFLEYGTNWFAKNADARLTRIEYAEGNRNPHAVISADKLYGAAPLTVNFSGAGSVDYDPDDGISASTWKIGNDVLTGEQVQYRFAAPGVYKVRLTVEDRHGGRSEAETSISVGNTPPEVMIHTKSNRSFYWPDSKMFYDVQVTDPEDIKIDPERLRISFKYFPQGKDIEVVLADDQNDGDTRFIQGRQLTLTLDCKACHSMKDSSAGPSYRAVAHRYFNVDGAVEQLSKKIIQGGGGNWGDRQMSPHPDLGEAEAKQIVQYILSLADTSEIGLPAKGDLQFKAHKNDEGAYLLLAAYTDNGANGIEPLSARKYIVLRSPLLKMEQFDEGTASVVSLTSLSFLNYISRLQHNGFVKFKQLDLSGIKKLKYRVQLDGEGGTLELRLDRPDGKLVSTLTISPGKVQDRAKDWIELVTEVSSVEGTHDLYFVFSNPKAGKKNLFNLDWVYFLNK
ncbi:MAG TPA: PQQ-dependent sugar dehydrogenase [Agriterribacter sp.]|nr:PQQ-dependent sugar dehydrogenase [Agriterribacter sp.]